MKIMAAALFTLVLCAGAALAWGATAWVLWEHEEVESYSQGRDNGDKWKLHDAAETYTECEAMLRATWKTKSDLLKTIEKFGYSIASQPGFISVLSNVQFFFSETKSVQQVSRFRLWDPRFENPTVNLEKRPPHCAPFEPLNS